MIKNSNFFFYLSRAVCMVFRNLTFLTNWKQNQNRFNTWDSLLAWKTKQQPQYQQSIVEKKSAKATSTKSRMQETNDTT